MGLSGDKLAVVTTFASIGVGAMTGAFVAPNSVRTRILWLIGWAFLLAALVVSATTLSAATLAVILKYAYLTMPLTTVILVTLMRRASPTPTKPTTTDGRTAEATPLETPIPVAAPSPAPAPAQVEVREVAPRKEDRVYLPQRFVDKFVKLISERATDLQIEAMLIPEVGKWMRLHGVLHYIGTRRDGLYVQVVMAESNQSVFVDFDKSWKSQLAHLKIGEAFDFEARIGDDLPYLSDGELI